MLNLLKLRGEEAKRRGREENNSSGKLFTTPTLETLSPRSDTGAPPAPGSDLWAKAGRAWTPTRPTRAPSPDLDGNHTSGRGEPGRVRGGGGLRGGAEERDRG